MNNFLSDPPLRALVVDDDLDSVILLTTLLEMHGVDVTSAFCATQAMQNLRSQPDIVIADLAMPCVDGYALIRQIRALTIEQGGRIPAIAVSAWVTIGAQQEAISSGFQTFIAKPYQPSALIETVSQLTGWKPLKFEVAA